MGLTDTIFGTPGQTQVHQTAGTKPPGYNAAQQIFNMLLGLSGTPYPSYQGQIDPGLSPTMRNLLQKSQGYASAGAPEILQGVQGVLGRYMNPNFLNPIPRIYGGATDYANAGSSQWNDQWAFDPFGSNRQGGRNPATGGSSAGSFWDFLGPQRDQPATAAGPGSNTNRGGGGFSLQPPFPSYPSFSPSASVDPTRQTGAKPMWDMGAGANRGQVRVNPTTGQQEILLGAGGGEQYAWKPYNPNDYGQRQNADMFSRYGQNWTAGSGSSGGHSSDVGYWFEQAHGRAPSQTELYDAYYGVTDAAPLRQAAKNANAQYDPSSASYDPAAVSALSQLRNRR